MLTTRNWLTKIFCTLSICRFVFNAIFYNFYPKELFGVGVSVCVLLLLFCFLCLSSFRIVCWLITIIQFESLCCCYLSYCCCYSSSNHCVFSGTTTTLDDSDDDVLEIPSFCIWYGFPSQAKENNEKSIF